MSISSYSYLANLYEKKSHLRNDSYELDVFEAAQYFSDDYNDGDHVVPHGASSSEEKVEMEEKQVSLDTPMHDSPLQTPKNDPMENKQPNSPSGNKLANFLSSLFYQTNSKKKKSINFTTETLKEHTEDPRSSISNFTLSNISSTTNDSTSFNSSSTFTNTNIDQIKSIVRLHDNNKIGFSDHVSEGNGKSGIEKLDHQDDIWVDQVDDGAESDSSSDLFELQNYDLKYCCYKSTNMECIKRGTQVL